MHQKHAKLSLSNVGNFGRNEWAVLGTPCGNIKKLAFQLTEIFSASWKVGYVDADHQNADAKPEGSNLRGSALKHGAALAFTDKIAFGRFDSKAKLDAHHYPPLFNEMDLVLVNGNHFKAKRQIVVVDPKKAESLKRKLDRLTDVQLILLVEGVQKIPAFLKEHIRDISSIPVFKIDEVEKIAAFLNQKLQAAIPPLNGLALAGGKSLRMGKDKGLLNYHGKPQRDFLFESMSKFCEETFISCRPDQVAEISKTHPALPDSFLDLGPFGAILSAFREQPNKAWLVIACDLPLLEGETLKFLIENRNPSSVATAFYNPATGFPEPLITIWEPKSYLLLLQFLVRTYSCPRKVLINSNIQLLNTPNPAVLKNVNKPEELEEIREILKLKAR